MVVRTEDNKAELKSCKTHSANPAPPQSQEWQLLMNKEGEREGRKDQVLGPLQARPETERSPREMGLS